MSKNVESTVQNANAAASSPATMQAQAQHRGTG